MRRGIWIHCTLGSRTCAARLSSSINVHDMWCRIERQEWKKKYYGIYYSHWTTTKKKKHKNGRNICNHAPIVNRKSDIYWEHPFHEISITNRICVCDVWLWWRRWASREIKGKQKDCTVLFCRLLCFCHAHACPCRPIPQCWIHTVIATWSHSMANIIEKMKFDIITLRIRHTLAYRSPFTFCLNVQCRDAPQRNPSTYIQNTEKTKNEKHDGKTKEKKTWKKLRIANEERARTRTSELHTTKGETNCLLCSFSSCMQ